jgi:hypothetical protein
VHALHTFYISGKHIADQLKIWWWSWWWWWWQWWSAGGRVEDIWEQFLLNQFTKHPLLTVQQYFCTLSHSQQFVHASRQHAESTLQKSKSHWMSFHWWGWTITVMQHKICHYVHEYQHVSAISLISKWQKITNMYLFFEQYHIIISEICCLIIPLFHNDCLS